MVAISRMFRKMNKSSSSDYQWILATINNILLNFLPKSYNETYLLHLKDTRAAAAAGSDTRLRHRNQSYSQERHFRKVGKEFRRKNRIHQPGCDVQRRDHRRKR